jgi:hypothetical protein
MQGRNIPVPMASDSLSNGTTKGASQDGGDTRTVTSVLTTSSAAVVQPVTNRDSGGATPARIGLSPELSSSLGASSNPGRSPSLSPLSPQRVVLLPQAPRHTARFTGALCFPSLGMNATVLGNFTLQRVLVWTYDAELAVFKSKVDFTGTFDMQLQREAAAGSAAQESAVLGALQPAVSGTLGFTTIHTPGPGFSGDYTWDGSVQFDPDPFTLFAALAAEGSGGAAAGPLLRHRAMQQAASTGPMPVEGPVGVREEPAVQNGSSSGSSGASSDSTGGGTASGSSTSGSGTSDTSSPAAGIAATGSNAGGGTSGGGGTSSESSTSGGGSPISGSDSSKPVVNVLLLDPDGSIQIIGPMPAPSTAGSNTGSGAGSGASSEEQQALIAPVPNAGSLEKRTTIILMAALLGSFLGLGLCAVMVAAAVARRGRASAQKQPAQPSPTALLRMSGAAIKAAAAVLGASARGGPALHSAPPGAAVEDDSSIEPLFGNSAGGWGRRLRGRVGEEAAHGEPRESLLSLTGAHVAAALGTLGYGFRRSITGALPGYRYSSMGGNALEEPQRLQQQLAAAAFGLTSPPRAAPLLTASRGWGSGGGLAQARSRVSGSLELTDLWAGGEHPPDSVSGAPAEPPAVSPRVRRQRVGAAARDAQLQPGVPPRPQQTAGFMSHLIGGRDWGGGSGGAAAGTAVQPVARGPVAAGGVANPLFERDSRRGCSLALRRSNSLLDSSDGAAEAAHSGFCLVEGGAGRSGWAVRGDSDEGSCEFLDWGDSGPQAGGGGSSRVVRDGCAPCQVARRIV